MLGWEKENALPRLRFASWQDGWKDATPQLPWPHFPEKGPASMTETLAGTWKTHLCVSQAVSKSKDSDTLRLLSVQRSPSGHLNLVFFLKRQKILEIDSPPGSTTQAAPTKVSQVYSDKNRSFSDENIRHGIFRWKETNLHEMHPNLEAGSKQNHTHQQWQPRPWKQ